MHEGASHWLTHPLMFLSKSSEGISDWMKSDGAQSSNLKRDTNPVMVKTCLISADI